MLYRPVLRCLAIFPGLHVLHPVLEQFNRSGLRLKIFLTDFALWIVFLGVTHIAGILPETHYSPKSMIIEEEIRERFEAMLAMNTRHMGHMLGMAFEEVGRERLVATMPVNENTTQPFGMLHGGASVALAESLASIGAYLNINDAVKTAVGLEINANHIRPVSGGFVRGTAVPLHRGAGTQIWDIKIHTADGRLVCVSRCTLAVVPVRRKGA